MPTGYTAKLYHGEEQSFEDFFLTTARAFCHIELRDEPLGPIPLTPYKPSTYHETQLEIEREKLTWLRSLTPKQIEAQVEDDHKKAVKRVEESNAESSARRVRFQDMMNQVLAWEPPTERHEKFKQFMIDQLNTSLASYDCEDSEIPEKMSTVTWRENQITMAERGIEYHEKQMAAEKERSEQNNEWVTALVESIGLEIQESTESETANV